MNANVHSDFNIELLVKLIVMILVIKVGTNRSIDLDKKLEKNLYEFGPSFVIQFRLKLTKFRQMSIMYSNWY